MKYNFLMCVNRDTGFLGEALSSVLAQSDPEFGFIIVANNCDDALWDRLNNIDDSRVRVYRTGIGQLAYNLNYGIDLAMDGYVLRMDADDICFPDRLAITRKWLEEHDYPDIVGGQAAIIDEVGVIRNHARRPLSNRAIRQSLWMRCPIIHPTCALKVSTVLRLNGYCGGFMSEDYELWLRAAREKDIVFANIPEELIKYRISHGQARGRTLGYCETMGYMCRETWLRFRIDYFMGSFLCLAKCLLYRRS